MNQQLVGTSWSFATLFVLLNLIVFCVSDPWTDNGMKIFCNREPYSKIINRDGCQSETFKVHACLGLCRSYAKPSAHPPHFINKCQCCLQTTSEMKKFSLSHCKPGIDTKVTIESAVDCACKTCNCA